MAHRLCSRLYFGAFCALMLSLPVAALAQVASGSPPPPGIGQLIVQGLFAPPTLSVLIPLLAGGLAWWIRDRAVQAAHGDAAAEARTLALANQRLALIGWAADCAYFGVTNLTKLSPSPGLDKTGLALGLFRQALASHGVTPTEAELQRAKLTWDALHGRERLALEVSAPVVVDSIPAAETLQLTAGLPAPAPAPTFIPDGAARPTTPPGAK